jgi:lauroyl/myristoyl acyltransferase
MPVAQAVGRRIRRALVVGHSSTLTRRVLPAGAMFKLTLMYAGVQQRGRRLHWRTSRDFYRDLLRYTPLAGSEDDVARRSVAEWYQCAEVFWRPWLMRQGEIEGLAHFEAARAQGRGIVLVFPHFGLPYAQFPVMRRFGIDAWVIASSRHYEDLGDGYDARMARHGRGYVDMLGLDRAIVRRPGQGRQGSTFEQALALLRNGAAVSVAFDLPGRTVTPFLGRAVSLVSGPSQLATQSDALVVPFVVRLRDRRPLLEFASPLDARELGDPAAIQAALAFTMERWVIDRPEAVWPSPDETGVPLLTHGAVLSGSLAGQPSGSPGEHGEQLGQPAGRLAAGPGAGADQPQRSG